MVEQLTVWRPDGRQVTVSRKAYNLIYANRGYSLEPVAVVAEIDGEPGEGINLGKMTRAELEEYAAGVRLEGPYDRFSNKAALVAAILAHEAEEDT